MLMKLDRSKPFGRVAPPMEVPGFDRPAYYEQDGTLFDAHDLALADEAPAVVEKPKGEAAPALSVEDLINGADTLAYPVFHRGAKAILGDKCPSGKRAIVAALTDAKAVYDERKAKHAAPAPAVAAVTAPESPPRTTTAPSKAGIDLAAWGRGQRDYIFTEVQKAVRTTYHAQLSERRAVVEFLIEQGVITAAEARRDVN